MLHKIKLVFLLVLVNAMAISVAHSAFYKWVDKNGQVHYTHVVPLLYLFNIHCSPACNVYYFILSLDYSTQP